MFSAPVFDSRSTPELLLRSLVETSINKQVDELSRSVWWHPMDSSRVIKQLCFDVDRFALLLVFTQDKSTPDGALNRARISTSSSPC